jgi:glycine/serine hydroxymethyltransferase
LGVAAATTRGLTEADMAALGAVIARVVKASAEGGRAGADHDAARAEVARLCRAYPLA